MPVMNITDADLSDAILKALTTEPKPGREPGTITRPEMARDYNMSIDRAEKILKQLISDGTVEKAFVKRVDGWGCNAAPKGYRLIRGDSDGISHSTNDTKLA
jgi:hypothetical protein